MVQCAAPLASRAGRCRQRSLFSPGPPRGNFPDRQRQWLENRIRRALSAGPPLIVRLAVPDLKVVSRPAGDETLAGGGAGRSRLPIRGCKSRISLPLSATEIRFGLRADWPDGSDAQVCRRRAKGVAARGPPLARSRASPDPRCRRRRFGVMSERHLESHPTELQTLRQAVFSGSKSRDPSFVRGPWFQLRHHCSPKAGFSPSARPASSCSRPS